MSIIFEPIGIIETTFHKPSEIPVQHGIDNSNHARIILNKELITGLHDIEQFSHIMLFYFFHKSVESSLTVVPYTDDKPHGVFSTRSPSRPNALGFSIVELVHVWENILYVKGIDILNNTPLLDIKPYCSWIDSKPETNNGWFKKESLTMKADNRFLASA